MGRKGRDVTLWVFRSFRFLEALVVGCLWRSGQQFSLKSRACHFSGKVRSDTLWFAQVRYGLPPESSPRGDLFYWSQPGCGPGFARVQQIRRREYFALHVWVSTGWQSGVLQPGSCGPSQEVVPVRKPERFRSARSPRKRHLPARAAELFPLRRGRESRGGRRIVPRRRRFSSHRVYAIFH